MDRPERNLIGGSRVRGGFTLLELLVVIAIIAILLSILFPALRSTRLMGGRAVCINNLRQITAAALMYSSDQRDGMFPLVPAIYNENGYIDFDGWKYGGKTAGPYWRNNFGGAYAHPVQTRLVNSYAYPDISLRDPPGKTLELELFKCPSDDGTYQRGNWYSRPPRVYKDTSISGYDDVGTSYQLNVKWWREAVLEAQAYSGGISRSMMWNATKRMFTNAGFQQPWKFVWLHDQVLDIAVITGAEFEGDHGERLRSSAAFLDGHADYVHVTPENLSTSVSEALQTEKYTLKLSNINWSQWAPR